MNVTVSHPCFSLLLPLLYVLFNQNVLHFILALTTQTLCSRVSGVNKGTPDHLNGIHYPPLRKAAFHAPVIDMHGGFPQSIREGMP